MQRGFDGQGEVCACKPGVRWGGPGLDLDIARRGTAVRLVSRQNPVGSFSGIGPK